MEKFVEIRPIRTKRDHARAMKAIEQLWGARPGTPQAEQLEVLVTLVDAWETAHHPIDPPDPIEAILFRMQQAGMTRSDLERILGSRSRVSEILNRRRPLTLSMIRRLRKALGISADILVGEETKNFHA